MVFYWFFYFLFCLFWKNSKPIRSCARGSTENRNLSAFCLFVCFIEFKGFPRQDLRSPDRGDLRNGFVVCDCELDKDW